MSHGADAIVEIIDESDWSYPVTVRRLERVHGLDNVRLDAKGDHYVMVIELLSRGDLDRFESEADLREQVAPLVEEELSERRSGILDTVKGLLGLE